MSGNQQVTGNINSFNVLTSHTNIVNLIAENDDEGRQIIQWLSPLEPQQRHQGLRSDRLDGVGNWVLETNEFRKWSDTEDGCAEPVLFCHGNPGVGKTYLSSLVIDGLCEKASGVDTAVVGVYCDFLTQQEQSTTSMLGSILKQLIIRQGFPVHIREAFREAKKGFGGQGLQLSNLVEILKKTISSLPRVFICIDALDESAPKHRRELLRSLRQIVRVSPNTRIFLTGRPHIDNEIVVSFSKAVRIPLIPTQDDIKRYLEGRLDGDTNPHVMDNELRADIMRVIPEKISEIFLLVSLNIDAILGEVTLHRRRKKLDEMTKGEGLGNAYAATLSRVKAQQRGESKLGMEVLMWVSHSERPLHVDELCHALGVEVGSTNPNIQNIPAIETVLKCCLGLVTVKKSSLTVRLVHYTLQEYLSSNPSLFLKPHSQIAEVCLIYLDFQHVRDLSPTLRSAPPTAPFVEYASCYWGAHARRETTEPVKALALKLLDGYEKHISSKMLLLRGVGFGGRHSYRQESRRLFLGLHSVAYFGCAEITIALLEMNMGDARATDSDGNTAIAWAARRGHEGVVGILLEQNGVNPNTADTKYGRTPLSWAAGNGHEGVVRILLERGDVNPNIADTQYGGTPLSWAAENGHEEVVRMLLERNGVNPNTADTKYGGTPLSWAAWNGHEGVVRALLGRNDVNPNTADTHGRTPLSWAAGNGREGAVRVLLERNDVNSNATDIQYGRTPLSWAAGDGHEGVVKILLERGDVNLNTADTQYGGTPLSWAAENGHEGVVRMLLERNGTNPNTADTKYGGTPLSWAAWNGHEGIARALLSRNDVNPNTADTHGRTPLSWAAGSGHEGVVRVLTERNDVNLSTADTKSGRTPLQWAVRNKHGRIAKLLQERTDLIPRYSTSLRSTELFSPEPSDLPELPSKRTRRL